MCMSSRTFSKIRAEGQNQGHVISSHRLILCIDVHVIICVNVCIVNYINKQIHREEKFQNFCTSVFSY